MRLGRFFFDNKIETAVETKTACASACALAFLGGRDDAPASRTAPRRRTAGSASIRSSRDFDNKSYSADDLKIVVQQTQTQVFVVAEYLKSIGADLDVVRG